MTDLRERLRAPFPKASESSLSKGGRNLTYVPIAEYIVRLNEVIGVGEWGYEVLSVLPFPADDPRHIVAHVRLHAFGQTFDGMGGQAPNRNKAGDILDLGDDFKGAVSDALKKASSHLEVGLYLSRKEGAMQAEEDAKPKPVRADTATHDELRTAVRELPARFQGLFTQWTTEQGYPKFGKTDSLTIGQVSAAHDEIGRLQREASKTESQETSKASSTQADTITSAATPSAVERAEADTSAAPADPRSLLEQAGITTLDDPKDVPTVIAAAREKTRTKR